MNLASKPRHSVFWYLHAILVISGINNGPHVWRSRSGQPFEPLFFGDLVHIKEPRKNGFRKLDFWRGREVEGRWIANRSVEACLVASATLRSGG